MQRAALRFANESLSLQIRPIPTQRFSLPPSQHIGARFKYHTEPPAEHVADSRVLTLAILELFPALRPTLSTQISEKLEIAEKVIDVGFLLVRVRAR